MNAVWVSDELMVSPSAVAGLIVRAEDDGYGATVSVSRWVNVVLISGHEEQVWSVTVEVPIGEGGAGLKERVEGVRAEQRAAAEAEVGRLSELLWPTAPYRAVERPAGINIGIYDPELYGLARCATASEDGQCNLAEGHPGDHRWGPTFSEAHPDAPCGSMSNAGYRCALRYGHDLPHVSHEFGVERVWESSDHI